MKFEDVKNQKVELYSIGGQIVSIEEMVQEIKMHRRNRFFDYLFSIEENKIHSAYTFDAVAFLAAIEEFTNHFNMDKPNYEGSIIYDVIAGSDWVWNCKTTITWSDTYPIVLGSFQYQTTVVANENVKMNQVYAMNGTRLEIKVIRKNLKVLSQADALEKSRRYNCK